MSVQLGKGGKVSLSKEDPSLRNVIVGLGWDTKRYDGGYDFDLDTACFMCGVNGKCLKETDFIFYNNLCSSDGSVQHTGDDRTGGNSEFGDDEQIIINLDKVPDNIEKLAFTATIFKADIRNQNFGQVDNAYIRVVNADTDKEILRYELGEDFSVETALVVGEIYRYKNEWKFNAVGSGFKGGLKAICANFGIDAED